MKLVSYKYEVVLSFAGEQREYVKKVSEYLTKLGIKHFYDNSEQVDLWGKNLAQYLDSIYFEQSKYFIPFISQEYIEKKWTKLELASALDRNMEFSRPDFQQYILPVKFEDIRVHGIVGSIGHIDACSVTPEKLAEIIYKKVRGCSPEKVRHIQNSEAIFPTTHYNMKINAAKYKELASAYTSAVDSHAIIVYGEKGLGKRTCLQNFLDNKENLVKISSYYDNQFQLEPILYALNLDTSRYCLKNDLGFREQIKKEFLSYCNENNPIIYIEKLDEFEEATTNFLLEVCETLFTRYSSFRTIIIFEFDIDEYPLLVEQFYKLPPNYVDFICFERLSSNELEQYFFQSAGNVHISEPNLTYILESSFGNIMYLNVIINYLRGKGLIHKKDDGIYCEDLPKGLLTDVLKEFVLQRFERLDSNLKDVLSKSAIVGKVFQSELLSKPFGIINANEMLSEIEEISKLITQPCENLFSFENMDVYNLIRKNISPQMQKEWHQVLAQYFENQFKRKNRHKSKITVEKEIAMLYPIAKHYMYSQNYEYALPYYLDLIINYDKISDYQHELDAIKDIRIMLNEVDLDKLHLDTLEYDVQKKEADCNKEIGNYLEAYDLYKECCLFFETSELTDEYFEVIYQKAYCLYMSGNVEYTLTILNSLKKDFDEKGIYNKFYMKTIAFLASVYDVTGDTRSKNKYYLEALNYYRNEHDEQEYYTLLRTASMIFGEELAIGMYEETEKYFRSIHSIRYLAEVLHNKATDLLYIGELSKVKAPLTESIQLFDSYGSLAVHYPLNTNGIFEMIYHKNFSKAVSVFTSALQYDIEIFSKVTLRTNLLNCYNKLGNYEKAFTQLQIIDSLINKPESKSTLVYSIYHHLNWAFYYYHTGNHKRCLEELEKCSKLEYMEPRYMYVYKMLKYYTKSAMGLKTRKTAGTPSNKVFKSCVENGFYFTTVRFYE